MYYIIIEKKTKLHFSSLNLILNNDSSYLFLHCQFFGEVWHYIHRWLGVCSVILSVPMDSLNQFGFVGGSCSKARQSILLLIWFAAV